MDVVRTAEVKTTVLDGVEIKVVVKLFVDDYPHLEDFGEWTDRENEFVVDTRRGCVLGEELPEPEEPYEPEETEDENPGAWAEYEIAYEEWDKAYEEWEENPYELLYETGMDWERHNYRYYEVDDGLTEMWADACKLEDAKERKAEKERVAELAGKLYARIKDHGNGWNMCFMTIDIVDNCAVIGSDSLGGVESDMNATDWEGITADIFHMAKMDAGDIDGMNWEEVERAVIDAVLDW
jgi:hypothetical protein